MTSTKKIIIADDSPSIRVKLAELLKEKGFHVITANDGIDCIKKIFQHLPNFVVLDVKMPIMNGYQACRFLKNHPFTKNMPVMLLTALDQPIDELWGYEAGADYYKNKTTGMKELVNEIEKIIKNINFVPSFKPKDMTDNEILSFINDFLDKRLFEISMINAISQISYLTNDLVNVIEKCASLLYKMLDFYLVAFSIVEQDKINIYMWSPYEYGSHIDEFHTYINETICRNGYGEPLYEYNFGKEVLPGRYFEKKDFLYINPYENINDKSAMPIKGGVFFCFNRDNQDSLKRIFFILNHILLVVNNCLLHKKVVDMSMTDELTTLYNRRKILEILRTEIERSIRYNYELAVIMADIDYFKKINDVYGHQMGDLVLKKVSLILRNSLRKVDYVGRFGGEEFIIISPETSLQNATLLAERIRKIFNALTIEGVDHAVTLSFGVSIYKPGKDGDTLIREADAALYEAKRSGRNQVKLYKGEA